jgi:Ca2+-binding RTX toxin-like protein
MNGTRGGEMRRTILFLGLTVVAALSLPQIASAAVPKCLGRKATIVGTHKAELIKGTPKGDVIVGLGGGDTIKGLGGDDWICGGKGADKLIGGIGSDVLSGDVGTDTVAGGGGANDWLVGGAGDDAFDGGPGKGDTATFHFAPAGVQADLTTGTATGEGTDTLTGIEYLEGSDFEDTLTGDAGSNYLFPAGGDDTVDGGGGIKDRVDYFFSTNAVNLDLIAGIATGDGTDTLTGIEQVFGSQNNDTITGDAAPNAMYGGPGNDTVSGRAGDDTLDGGKGADTLDGGDGTDTCRNGETNVNCEA